MTKNSLGASAAPAAQAGQSAVESNSGSEEALVAALLQEPTSEPAEPAAETASAGDDVPGTEPEAQAEGEEAVDEALSTTTDEVQAEEAEAPAKTEPAAEEAPADDDKELSDKVSRIPKLNDEQKQHVSKLIRERVGKVKGKVTELEGQLQVEQAAKAELEAKLQEAQSNVTVMPAESPLADVTTEKQLQEKAAIAQQGADFCEEMLVKLRRNPAEVERRLRALKLELRDADGEEDFSPDNMAAFLEEKKFSISRTLSRDIPARAKYLATEKQTGELAEKQLPWLKNAADPRTKKFNELVQANPAVKQFASWKFVMAHAINSVVLAEEAARKPATPPPVTPQVKAKPAVAPSGNAAPAKPDARTQQVVSTRKKALSTGSQKDLEAALMADM